jgi:hypothetical protein
MFRAVMHNEMLRQLMALNVLQDLTSVRIIDIEGIEAEPSLEPTGATAAEQEAKAA